MVVVVRRRGRLGSWRGRSGLAPRCRIVRHAYARLDAMMTDRLRSLLANRQFLRFLVAGGINTLFGFGVNVSAILAGIPVWLAMLLGTTAGVVFNFFTHGGYAFRDLSANRLPRYLLGYVIVYLVGLAAFHVLQFLVRDPIACQALLVVPMALLSYLVLSRFVFQKHRAR